MELFAPANWLTLLQPLALLCLLALLATGRGMSKQKKLIYAYVISLVIAYAIGLFTSWQQPVFVGTLSFIATLVACGWLFAVGLSSLYQFFSLESATLRKDVAAGMQRIWALRQKQLPWWIGSFGLLVGWLEPLRPSASVQLQQFIFMQTAAPGAMLSMLLLTVASSISLLLMYWLVRAVWRYSARRLGTRRYLLAAGILILTSWLGLLASVQFIGS